MGGGVEGSCSPSNRTPRLWEEIRFSSQSLGELLKGSEMIRFEFLSNGWPVGHGWPCGSREACGCSCRIAGTEIMMLLLVKSGDREDAGGFLLSWASGG